MTKTHLEVKLLGSPELRWRGHELISIPPKQRALVYYLAAHKEAVARGELEELLWGHGSAYSVRQALYQLRSLPGADRWLRVDGVVSVEAVTDLAAFEGALEKGQYKEALEVWLKAGPKEGRTALLSGFEFDISLGFTSWLEVERARVEMLYLETLECRALELEKTDAVNETLMVVQLLLREDRLNESAYRMAMRLCYRKGQPEMAQVYFERCRRALLEELGTQPLEETVALAHGSQVAGVYIQAQPMTLRRALEGLPDPRGRRGQRYPLPALLGLVLVAFLEGKHSVRDIARFGQDHPGLLRRLGFHHLTPPGRSALSEVLEHLNPIRLRDALNSSAPFAALAKGQGHPSEVNALGLLEACALELRQALPSGGDVARLGELLTRLGWPGVFGQAVMTAVSAMLEYLESGAVFGLG